MVYQTFAAVFTGYHTIFILPCEGVSCYVNTLTHPIPSGIQPLMNDNRLIILQTACQLFSKLGYDAVGVQEIIEKAGFTKPTLYHYFGSNQGLLDAILEHYLIPFNDQLSGTLHYQGDIQTSLRNIFNLYLAFAHHNAHFFRLWMAIRLSPLSAWANCCST